MEAAKSSWTWGRSLAGMASLFLGRKPNEAQRLDFVLQLCSHEALSRPI